MTELKSKIDPKDVFMYILGALITLGFFGVLALLITIEMPEKNESLLNIVLGALIAAFTGIVQYFYGSSRGSADKNKMIEKQNQLK